MGCFLFCLARLCFMWCNKFILSFTNPDGLELKEILYHENTKIRKHDKRLSTFRVFLLSCFRDCFYFFAILALNAVVFKVYCGYMHPCAIQAVITVATSGIVTITQSREALFQDPDGIFCCKLIGWCEMLHTDFLPGFVAKQKWVFVLFHDKRPERRIS